MKYFAKCLVLVVCLAVIVTSTACSMRLADLTVVSTRNVSLDKVDLDSLPQTKGVVGRDATFQFLFIPFGYPHVEDAIDDALNKGAGDIMLDAVIYSKGWSVLLIGQNILEVKGSVVKTRGN